MLARVTHEEHGTITLLAAPTASDRQSRTRPAGRARPCELTTRRSCRSRGQHSAATGRGGGDPALTRSLPIAARPRRAYGAGSVPAGLSSRSHGLRATARYAWLRWSARRRSGAAQGECQTALVAGFPTGRSKVRGRIDAPRTAGAGRKNGRIGRRLIASAAESVMNATLQEKRLVLRLVRRSYPLSWPMPWGAGRPAGFAQRHRPPRTVMVGPFDLFTAGLCGLARRPRSCEGCGWSLKSRLDATASAHLLARERPHCCAAIERDR